MVTTPQHFQQYIRNVRDFPKKGIVFRDITTLIANDKIFAESIEAFYEHYRHKQITKIVAIESRGFIFGSALAYRLKCGLVPVRKPNKLPAEKISQEYQLEYGSDTLEIHADALTRNDRVIVIDDLLATGGTAVAACALVEKLGATIVSLAFLIELTFLNGRSRLSNHDIFSLISYESE